ncbi:MAG: hypothetical protein NTV01_08530, partial [Bacteroidia bacterium]|nr:hypothetical protein [Bacteroidia bacterium]
NDKGYWVKMKAAKALTISGADPSKTISLALGWNLIGYPWTSENAVGTALQTIAGKYTIVWEFTPPSTWKSYDPNDPTFSDLTNFISGKGYWIKTTQAVEWSQVPASIQIGTLSTTSAVPASLLTISGSGFDPANSAISVLFTPNGSGVPIAVPVFSASANSLQVIVPPFLDRTSGFSSGVMDVQAIQMSGSSLMTSNTIGGLNVGSLPLIPSSDLSGAVTGAWINSGLMVLQNIQTFAGSTPSYADILSASNVLGSDMNSSLQAINSIKANPTQTKNLTTLNGSPFVLDAATLAASDRLVVAYLQQFLDFVKTPSAALLTTTLLPRSALATCVADLDPTTLTMICDGRTYNQQFAQVGSAVLPPAAKFVYGQWLSLAGAFAASGFLAAGVSEAAVNAFQLVWAASGPYVSALAAGGPAPTLKEPATEVATTLIDRVLNGAGTVLSGVLFGADLSSKANQVSSAPMGSAPAGGLIVFDPAVQPSSGSNALLMIQGFGTNASVLSVMAPKSQATAPLCTFSYSAWSECQSNNTQTRAVVTTSPTGCVGGTRILSQSCTYTPKCDDCYSSYSACTPGCDSIDNLLDKSDCINKCLADWQNCLNICEY